MEYYTDERLTKKIRKMSDKGLKKTAIYLYFKGRRDEKNHLIQEVGSTWQSPFIEEMRKMYKANSSAVYNEVDRLLLYSRQERAKLKHQTDAIDFQIARLSEDLNHSATNEEIRKKIESRSKIDILKNEKIQLEEETKRLENIINRIEAEGTQLLNRSFNIYQKNITRYLQAAKKTLDENRKVDEKPDSTAQEIYTQFVERYH
ncbi:MAG: hypothetical protein Q4D77_00295 [Peptostreptococcaceae bacterium]|nr:hypothetical protein [Peptostreptococcaceae bacterium]